MFVVQQAPVEGGSSHQVPVADGSNRRSQVEACGCVCVCRLIFYASVFQGGIGRTLGGNSKLVADWPQVDVCFSYHYCYYLCGLVHVCVFVCID